MKIITTMRNSVGILAEAMEEIYYELEPEIEEESFISEPEEEPQGVQTVTLPLQWDLELIGFYHQALIKLIGQLDLHTTRRLRRYLYLLRRQTDGWCRFTDENAEDEAILKNNLYYRFAYIYRNSTCISSAVAHYFSNVINRNPNILENLIRKKKVRICSMGGGSPSDIVALVKVLESKLDSKDDLDIHVTILDKDGNWKNTCYAVLMVLERFRNATCKIDFIETDLTRFRYTSNVLDSIENADIVSIVKMLSEVTSRKNKKDLIENVFKLVRPGSVIFVLDHPQYEIIACCGDFTGIHSGSLLIHQEIYGMHVLGLDAATKHFQIYSEHLGRINCNISLNVFLRVWQKLEPGGYWSSQSNVLNERIRKVEKKFSEDKLKLTKAKSKLTAERDSIITGPDLIIAFRKGKKLDGWGQKQITVALAAMGNLITLQGVELVVRIHAMDCELADMKKSLRKLRIEINRVDSPLSRNEIILLRKEEHNLFCKERSKLRKSIQEIQSKLKSSQCVHQETDLFKKQKTLAGWKKAQIKKALLANYNVAEPEAVRVIKASIDSLKMHYVEILKQNIKNNTFNLERRNDIKRDFEKDSLKILKSIYELVREGISAVCAHYLTVLWNQERILHSWYERQIDEPLQPGRDEVKKLRKSIRELTKDRYSLFYQNKSIISFGEEQERAGLNNIQIREAWIKEFVANPTSPQAVLLHEKFHDIESSIEELNFSLSRLKNEKWISIQKLKRENHELCLDEYLKNQKEIISSKRKEHLKAVMDLFTHSTL